MEISAWCLDMLLPGSRERAPRPRLLERSLRASSLEQAPTPHPAVAETLQCSGRPQVGRPRRILGRSPAGLPQGIHIGSNSLRTPCNWNE